MTFSASPHRRDPSTSLTRRRALQLGVAGGAGLLLPSLLPRVGRAAGSGASWRRYPYALYADSGLVMPQIEGRTKNETDTWYLDAKLVGQTTGRAYAFIVIYCKNRIAGAVRADFYTFALFDLDTGEYGTFTEFDFPNTNLLGRPKLTMAEGHLGLSARTSQGEATWTTRRDEAGALVPFAYEIDLVGRDDAGRHLQLSATVDPANPPAAAGGDATRGRVECFGQKRTTTYFQTAPQIDGTITWGGTSERVVGAIGHLDRQIFPRYAGVSAGLLARDRSHEWRSVNLDDGTDLSIWRQFDRNQRNRLTAYSGATRFVPGTGAVSASEVEVENISYVKWPKAIRTMVSAPSVNMYSPSEHVLRVPAWELELHARPLVPVPAHRLPVEYMIGPADYRGTLAGKPAGGFGVSERTLSLWRDWEIATVLTDTSAHLPTEAYSTSGVTPTELLAQVTRASSLTRRRLYDDQRAFLSRTVGPAVASLNEPHRSAIAAIVKDLRRAPIG